MKKFTEVVIVIILILLIYQTFKTEKFIATFSEALANKDFNFKGDARGRSEADKELAQIIRQN